MRNCPKCNESVKGKAKFCPACGAKVGRQTTDEKRSRLTSEKKSGKVPLFAVGAVVLVGVLALSGYALLRPAPESVSSAPSTSNPETSSVSFPVNTFDDGTAKYFQYQAPTGQTIKFFVLKSNDGVIRAAFDACDVCYGSKKGYRQEGDFMICNNCGQRFISTKINVIKGGCNPAPLEREIQGGNLVIAVSDILTGTRYF